MYIFLSADNNKKLVRQVHEFGYLYTIVILSMLCDYKYINFINKKCFVAVYSLIVKENSVRYIFCETNANYAKGSIHVSHNYHLDKFNTDLIYLFSCGHLIELFQY